MNIKTLMITTPLLASLMISGVFYAATGNAAETAKAPDGKEAAKDAANAPPPPVIVGTQLSEDKAKLYNDTMRQASEANKPIREQIQKAREEADAILTAEKFDKAAYLAKADDIDKLYGKARANMNQAFVSVAEKLSQADRKIIVSNRNARHHQQQMQQMQMQMQSGK